MTLVSAYLPSHNVTGLEEIVPEQLRKTVAKYEDYDYLGTRIRGEIVKNLKDAANVASEVGISISGGVCGLVI